MRKESNTTLKETMKIQGKREKEEIERNYENSQKTINRMAIRTYLSIVTVNVKGLNSPNKRLRVTWIKNKTHLFAAYKGLTSVTNHIELYIRSSSFILLISETSVTICPFNSYYFIFLCLYLFSWSVSRAFYRYFQRTKLLLDQHSLFYFLSSLLIFALIFIMSLLLCSLGLTCQVFFNFLKLMNSSLIFRLLI